ncbi:hypothetical protein BGZ80_010733 [Entomortierella chlamydospora]|uniref:Uncharacterized protein n=1 Tax=Entomortierella chlamydospora TaxID=101097 RepID=A0A9P6SZT1_9FUNG|nr:hypothetical protein BGZ79_009427 [Entomortierella chlamydospora]KAG0013980.1 hypothetical protein BGZ80_010733 [Entomortierella chlamydospora]
MASHSLVTLTCLVLLLLATTINALPAPKAPFNQLPFRFDVSAPKLDTVWRVDSLPRVSWDAAKMPEKSTMDIALLNHERKESVLLRRYVPAHLGSTLVNLRPEITSGTYSLLLTVYKGRTSTAIGRSLIQSLILVDNEAVDPEELLFHADTSNVEKKESVVFKKQNEVTLESELVELTHQPTKGNLVLRAPYTVGWTIPKALENVRNVRVNLLLVNRRGETIRTLVSNIDAKAGFTYVFLPEDTPIEMYRIKVEIVGNGRKFSGYTHRFSTSLPAFSARS